VSDASDARRKLIETCPDAALREELAAVSDELNELRAHAAALRDRGELVKQADREEEAADRLTVGLVPGAPPTRIDQMRDQADRNRRAGQEALAALPAVHKEIAKLESEGAAVYERMARP
jgi:predicted  nucleic acid-binding Zn-ribbon protein